MNREAKLQEIQDVGSALVKAPMRLAFASAVDATMSAQEVERALDGVERERLLEEEHHLFQGDISGNVRGYIARNGASASEKVFAQRQEQEAKARAQNSTEMFLLLDALNNGTIGDFIADQVFDSMSDGEIADLVSDIVTKTGQSFDDYARSVLGDDMPERKPDESDADYQRRVLKELADEMLDDNGNIKPKYQGDPVAQFLAGNDKFKSIKQKIASLDAEVQAHGMTEDVQAEAEDVAGKSYKASTEMDRTSSSDELQEIGNDAQIKQTAEGAKNATRVAESSEFASKFRASSGISDDFNSAASAKEIKAIQDADYEQTSTPEAAFMGPGLGPI